MTANAKKAENNTSFVAEKDIMAFVGRNIKISKTILLTNFAALARI